jgi:rod shape-determining protein MreC
VIKLFIKNRTWIVLAGVLLLALLLFFGSSFLSASKSLSVKLFSLPLKFFSGTGQYFASKGSLSAENSDLRNEVGSLSLRVDRFKELIEENRRLRELLRFKKKIGFETVSAEVIARNPNDWVGSFVINKGYDDGVFKDSAICSAKGLLGKVAEAEKNTSSVILLTHPGFKIGGMLKKSRINGIVVGSGRGMAKMLYLPVDADIPEGSTIVTSGFSQIFPKGITIGEVVSVKKSRTGLYKYAEIKPSASSSDQEEVLCITD